MPATSKGTPLLIRTVTLPTPGKQQIAQQQLLLRTKGQTSAPVVGSTAPTSPTMPAAAQPPIAGSAVPLTITNPVARIAGDTDPAKNYRIRLGGLELFVNGASVTQAWLTFCAQNGIVGTDQEAEIQEV